MVNGFSYIRNGFTMLEMTLEFDKRLIYMINDVYISGKWIKYLRDGKNFWKCLKYLRNGLKLGNG